MKSIIHPYKKDSTHSYATGAYATIELLTARPERAEIVYIRSEYDDFERLSQLCSDTATPIQYGDTAFKRSNQKENTYVLGLFAKYTGILSPDAPHVVLVNPSDMGNLGTIIRTIAGFNVTNLAIITPAADIWHPKTIRASMGALFRLEIEHFSSFSRYCERFKQHELYPFMLSGEKRLTFESCPKGNRYSLIFGNEASGLPESFRRVGTSFNLPQSAMVDSLNLSVAVGIGTFMFANANGQV